MNLSFVLPGLINSFSNLNKVFNLGTGLLGTFQALFAKNAAISALNAAGYEIESKAIKKKSDAELKDLLIEEYLRKNEVKLNGIRLTSIAELNAEQKQILLDSMAKTVDGGATDKLTKSQLALNASMLASPIG
jgi:hypothetical protein